MDQEIIRIFASIHPHKLILFGSRAKSTHDEYSDVDLIVVYPTNKRFLDRLAELYVLWDLPYAVDILAYTPEEFKHMSQESAFIMDAVKQGRVIYDATSIRSVSLDFSS